MKAKKIYIVYTEKFGEAQFVFDEQLQLLDGWNMNDANYRHEYMNGFLEKLGIKVEKQLPANADKQKLLRDAAKELWGFTEDDE